MGELVRFPGPRQRTSRQEPTGPHTGPAEASVLELRRTRTVRPEGPDEGRWRQILCIRALGRRFELLLSER